MRRWGALVSVLACATACSALSMGDPSAEFEITNECRAAIEVAVMTDDADPDVGDWFVIESGQQDRGYGLDLPPDEHSLYLRAPDGHVADVLPLGDAPVAVSGARCPDEWRSDPPDWLLMH